MRSAWALVLVLLAGCPSSPSTDAPDEADAQDATGLDAPGLDAPLDAPGLDAPGLDAPGLDAPLDAPGLDAPLDAPELDAAAMDAPELDAAAMDAPAIDAPAIDAPTADAPGADAPATFDVPGLDAPGADVPVTTCSVSASPTSVRDTETVVLSSASNGTGCVATIDTFSFPIDCATTYSATGATFGVGMHTVQLDVGSGPGGPTSCSTTFTVTPTADAGGGTTTSCSIDVTPETSTTAATVRLTGVSNGTACSVRIDGGAPLVVPCVGAIDAAASSFGVGDHVIELFVGDGPSGMTSCTDTFVVTGPITSCSIAVTPESGPASTTFTGSFVSDGTTCTLEVDLVAFGTVPCIGSVSSPGSALGPGMHLVTLRVADGPGGATACSDTITITP